MTDPARSGAPSDAPTGAPSPAAAAGGAAPTARRMPLSRSILVLGSLSAFGPLSMDLYLPALPELAAGLSTSDALAQTTMSACMIGLGAGQLIAGPLSDRWGRRWPLIVGVALFALLSLACALAPTIELLITARFLQGLAGSAGVVVSLAIARDMFSGAELSRMLSLLALVSSGAPILAPVLGGQLVRIMDWRGVFLVLAGIGAVLLVIALTGLRETLPPDRRHTGGARLTAAHFAALAHDRQYRRILLVAAFSSAGFFAYLSMSPFVFQEQFAATPAGFSLVFAANSLAVLAGSQVNGVAVRRAGPRRMYLLALTLSACVGIVLLGAALLGAGFGVFAGILCAMMFATGLSGPNGSTLALHHHGVRAGTASSVYGVVMFGAGSLAVPLVALLGTSAITMAATMATGTVLAAAAALLLVRPELVRNGL